MKNLINVDPKSLIIGALLGGLAIFTIAADSRRSTAWEYNTVYQQIPAYLYTKTINETATNGWELVGSQIIPKAAVAALSTDDVVVYMVLRHPK
jgi:hypothetical protein